MLLSEIIQPIHSFAAYSFIIDRSLQNPPIHELSENYDTVAQGPNIYGGDESRGEQYLQGLNYRELLKFWFTVYRVEIEIDYSVNSINKKREWNADTMQYDYEQSNTIVNHTRNLKYHFTKKDSSIIQPEPNPDPLIFMPPNRACLGVGRDHEYYFLPTEEPNIYEGLRIKEQNNFLIRFPEKLEDDELMSLPIYFNHTLVSPSPSLPPFERNLIRLGAPTGRYFNDVEVNPVKYLKFTATWQDSTGKIIKRWLAGKIPIGQNAYISQGEPYNFAETISATGEVHFKFTSFECK